MKRLCRNPECKLRRDEPHVLAREDLHHPSNGVDQLVRAMRVFGNQVVRGILVNQRGNRDSGSGIVSAFNRLLSHWRYLMTEYPACANGDSGPFLSYDDVSGTR